MAGLPLIAFASKCEMQAELEFELDMQVEVQLEEEGVPHKSNGSGNREPSAYTAQSKPKTPSFSTPSSGTARESWMNVYRAFPEWFVEGPRLNMLS
jgi:hypothetical protein